METPFYHVRDCVANTNVLQHHGPITFVAKRQKSDLLTIGARIAWAREQRGLTQGALAKAVGVSQGTIGNAESGLRGKPRELLKIAEALAVSPQWLERNEGEWNVILREPLTPVVSEPFISETERALLEDFKMLPDDEKAALRATLKAKADNVRRIVNEYLGKRGIPTTPVSDERVAEAFGAPPPPPTGAGSWQKITPVPEAPKPPSRLRGLHRKS